MTLKQRMWVLAALGMIGLLGAVGARLQYASGPARTGRLRNALDDAWHRGNYARVAELYSELQAIEPDNPDNYVDQAFTLHTLERDEESLAAYARGMEAVPGAWYLPFHRGYQFHYRWRHDPARALEDLDRAARLVQAPDDTVTVLRQKANLHALLEQWDALRATSEQVLVIDPTNRIAQRDLDRVALRVAWNEHDRAEAEALIDRLRAADPADKVAADFAARLRGTAP